MRDVWQITPDGRQEEQRWRPRSSGSHHEKQSAEENSFHLDKNKRHFCQFDIKMNLRSRCEGDHGEEGGAGI